MSMGRSKRDSGLRNCTSPGLKISFFFFFFLISDVIPGDMSGK